jgi:hypothetical protein
MGDEYISALSNPLSRIIQHGRRVNYNAIKIFIPALEVKN